MQFGSLVQTVKFRNEPTYALVCEHNASTDCANIAVQFDEWQWQRFVDHVREMGVDLRKYIKE